MKFILNNDKLKIDKKEFPNSGSIKYYEIDVEHTLEWNNLIIEARFIKEGSNKGFAAAVINNKVYIDRTLYGNYYVGFIGYKLINNTKIYQISTNLMSLYFQKGAGEIELTSEGLPSVSEWDIYIAQIKDITSNLEKEVKIVEEKVATGDYDGFSPIAYVKEISNGAVITITDKKGTTYATIHDGTTQDISGKFDKSSVKTQYSTTEGNVYDVTYINSTLGDIETLLGGI